MGRPSTYSREIADRLCAHLAMGLTLREVCRGSDEFPPSTTVREWVLADVDGFAERYARARESGYLEMADEVLDIADDGTNDWVERHNERTGKTDIVFDNEHYQRSKLRYEARRWLLSKCLPKIYGDKLALGGHDGGPLQVVVQKFTDDSQGG